MRKQRQPTGDATPTTDAADPEAATEPARSIRGVGWKKDVADDRDWSARAHFGAPRGGLAEALGLVSLLEHVDDQGGTSSCVAHALETAVEVRLRKLGYQPPKLSRREAYDIARMLARGSSDAPLIDQGCFPRDMMRGLRDFGICADEVWPFSEAGINDELPWDVQQRASAFRVTGWWRIDSHGSSRVADVAHALEKGYPVIFGTEVDAAFERFVAEPSKGTQSRVMPAAVDNLGGHMLCLLGYTTDNAERVFRGVNSWGYGWGDRGLFWAGEAFITDSRASDYYIIEVAQSA